MRKIWKTAVSLMCLMTVCSSVACGPTLTPNEQNSGNSGRLYSIKVAVSNAGFGLEWARKLANDYNELNADSDYGIEIIDYGIKWADSVVSDLKSGTDNQIYINAGTEITSAIYQDYLEDLSDILDDKVDGESGGTLQDKIRNYDLWKSTYSKYGEGVYAMPYSSAVVGMVIDHKEFIDNGWYLFAGVNDKEALTAQGVTFTETSSGLAFVSSTTDIGYKEGDRILTAGKDGKYGTYDDGQPQTYQEFNDMLKRISLTAKPFICGGGVADYIDHIFNSIFAQYAGVEDYATFYDYNSDGKEVSLAGGVKEIITVDNGYKVYQMEALTKAYEVVDYWFDYTSGVAADYAHPACRNTSASQYDTQNLFLLGYKGATSNPKSAIMIEGTWWENEATAMFNSLDNVNRGKGDREYRFLMLPTFDGQKDTKSCLSTGSTGVMVVKKDSNEERLNETKKFLKFLLKEESLRTITEMTGDILGYKYELTAENRAKMTPFQYQTFDLYQDSENIRIVQQRLDNITSPLTFASDKGSNNLLHPVVSGVFPRHCLEATKQYTISQITEGLKVRYKAEKWAEYVAQARKNGFFGN